MALRAVRSSVEAVRLFDCLTYEKGYLWSPKRRANGARNLFYEFMREIAPGDIVFSFVDTRIFAIGVAQSYCWGKSEARICARRPELGNHRVESRRSIHTPRS